VPGPLNKRTVTRVAFRAARTAPAGRLMDLLESLDRTREPVLSVLMYHRVGSETHTPQLDPSLLSATPAEFERQVEYLASKRRVLSLDELLEVRRGRMELPRRAVAVTFDDGYRDFAEHAWPALRRHGVSATLFVPTAYPGDAQLAFWWDRLHATFTTTARRKPLVTPAGTLALGSVDERARGSRTLGEWVRRTPHEEAMTEVERVATELGGRRLTDCVLSWDELRQLARDGLDIAPHTRTHPRVDRVSTERAKQEILGSATDLEREVGYRSKALAFPAGAVTDAVVRWLPEAGFELAFTTVRGGNHLDRIDWLRIRRINVGRRSALPLVRAQLLSWPTRAMRHRPAQA
jgi:peptidoglycan/xylan/chitin deacetylase (PgdA/CDA1 family)